MYRTQRAGLSREGLSLHLSAPRPLTLFQIIIGAEVVPMLVLDFPETFCGHQITMLMLSWCAHFADGKRLSNLVRPADLAEAVTACIYYDELPPVVAWDKLTRCYKIRRRTA